MKTWIKSPPTFGPAADVSTVKGKLLTKSLAFEAVRMGLWEDERSGAASRAHWTGRGEWYAVIDPARADNEWPFCWELISVEHVKAASRQAAVEAGQRLMETKADWVGEGLEISVNIRSALEWRPEED